MCCSSSDLRLPPAEGLCIPSLPIFLHKRKGSSLKANMLWFFCILLLFFASFYSKTQSSSVSEFPLTSLESTPSCPPLPLATSLSLRPGPLSLSVVPGAHFTCFSSGHQHRPLLLPEKLFSVGLRFHLFKVIDQISFFFFHWDLRTMANIVIQIFSIHSNDLVCLIFRSVFK